jgi:ParB family chromosome partitioning protein
VLRRVVDERLSVRDTEALARELNASEDLSESERDADLERLEDAFRQALGTRVKLVRSRGGGGRLVIHFYSDEELQGIYEALARGASAGAG